MRAPGRRPAVEQQVGAVRPADAVLLGHGSNFIPSLLDPGGIDQLDGEPIAVAEAGHVVAGRAGPGRDDRPVAAEQRVEQPALAGVGRPDQHDAGMASGAVAVVEPTGQVGQHRGPLRRARPPAPPADRVDVGLLAEIEVGLELGDEVEQAVARGEDRTREAARELLERGVELRLGRRLDDPEDGLGPRQVDPTGEEGPERELARLGRGGHRGPGIGPGTGSRIGGQPTRWISAMAWPV